MFCIVTCNVWYSDLVGWSKIIKFKTPPVGGSNESRFIVYGDMGKAPLDPSVEHYIQVFICYVQTFQAFVPALLDKLSKGKHDLITKQNKKEQKLLKF